MNDRSKRRIAWSVLVACAVALGVLLVAAVAAPAVDARPPRGPLPGQSVRPPLPPTLPSKPPTARDVDVQGAFVPSPDLDGREQAALERLNAVRADPPAHVGEWQEALRQALAAGMACGEQPAMLEPLRSYEARQPLAANQALTDAARLHAQDLLDRDYFDHVSPDGIGPNQRVIAAGYPLPLERPLYKGYIYQSEKDAKNIESLHWFAMTTNATYAFPDSQWAAGIDSLIVDACIPSRGHRDHLLGTTGVSPVEREIGVGIKTASEPKGGSTKHELELVIETGFRGDDVFYVLGVVYRDADGDGRYSLGEGVSGESVRLDAAGLWTTTGPGGGFTLPVPDGTRGQLEVAGRRRAVQVSGANEKLDVLLP